MTWAEERDRIWTPHDPNRACYGCGAPPAGTFPDGSPRYAAHSHPVAVATPDDVARYASQRPLVTLSDAQVAIVEQHAQDVIAAAQKAGLRPRWAFASKAEEHAVHVRGFGAEVAVATYLGLPWKRIVYVARRRSKPADVGTNVEVRTWSGKGRYCPIRDGDPAERLIVLAFGSVPAYVLQGWIVARDGMRAEYRFDDRHRHPYFRVPLEVLHLFPIEPGLAR